MKNRRSGLSREIMAESDDGYIPRSRARRHEGQSVPLETGHARSVFSSAEVFAIAQISLRQLQWWDERKLISPHQEGHRRIYLTEEVIEIMVVAELRRKGLSLQKVRRILRFLHRRMQAGQEYPVTAKSPYTCSRMANRYTLKPTRPNRRSIEKSS